jgi:hypothetical protein
VRVAEPDALDERLAGGSALHEQVGRALQGIVAAAAPVIAFERQATSGDWFLFDADGAPVPAPGLPEDPAALDLVLFHGATPVVQVADANGKLSYLAISGQALPAW